ncbi:MAG: response regulator [Thermodesulfobacteriota bacterium]
METVRVLLVDDEKQMVTSLGRLLRAKGFDVQTVFDGLEAVESISGGDVFDVVVMDVRMPGLDGITALARIKEMAPATEVIMLTGHAALEDGLQAIRLGAYDYLIKPCALEDLVDKIKEARQVENMKRQPVLWPRNKVSEVLDSSFTHLSDHDPLTKAWEHFQARNGESEPETLLILDSRRRLGGVVSKADLVAEARSARAGADVSWDDLRSHPEWLPAKKLSDLAGRDIITTLPEESLTSLAARMIRAKVRVVPVVENDRVVGVVRFRDILSYIDHEIE